MFSSICSDASVQLSDQDWEPLSVPSGPSGFIDTVRRGVLAFKLIATDLCRMRSNVSVLDINKGFRI